LPQAALALPPLHVSVASAQQYVISTYAGGAPQATPVPGMAVSIGWPKGDVATDAAGNVYFASDNCVFKLDTNGFLTRVAGNSRVGFSGDGGPATGAQLNPGPGSSGVAVDSVGNLYIADVYNQRIRKVTPARWPGAVARAWTTKDRRPARNFRVLLAWLRLLRPEGPTPPWTVETRAQRTRRVRLLRPSFSFV
jgi:hypothetical protein